MPTLISTIETKARQRLQELSPRFWSSEELVGIINDGVKDLWREIVNLKEEHFLVINDTDVSLQANADTLTGVPTNVHKVYLIEPRDVSESSSNKNLAIKPLDWNHEHFKNARKRAAIDPSNDVIYYAITGAGAPVGAPTIRVAPKVTSALNLTFAYIPTVGELASGSLVPIPGEADNALVAWTVAFARGKETDMQAPDPTWLSIYGTEKQSLLQALGVRQLQEQKFAEALFEEYW